jgi:hypothetical protein
MHLPLSLKLRKREIRKILPMFTILSQEVKKDTMKILLKCTRRPQVEVVEVEDEEDTVEVEVGITHLVEMVKKMEMKSVTLEGKERLDQMENSLNIQMNTTKIM